MKVVVLGGAGFIGQHVVEELVNRDIEPIVFDRYRRNGFQSDLDYDAFNGDVTDRGAVDYIVGMSDGAINLAGVLGTSETVNNPFPSAEVNIIGGLNFLEALRNNSVPGVQIAVGNHFMNNSYSITKTTAERFSLMYQKEHGTQVNVVRALNAYGERQKHAPIRKIIPNFVLRALNDTPIEVYGDGSQIMDMIYVKDIAGILVDALFAEKIQHIYEAGTGRRTTVLDIANMVNEISGSKAGVKHLPMRAGEPEKSVVLGDPDTLDSLPKRELVKLEDGLERTIAWYKEHLNEFKL